MTRQLFQQLNSHYKSNRHNLFPFGIRGQLKFLFTVLFIAMVLCGAMLSAVSQESIQNYHKSLGTISEISDLSVSLDNLDAAMTEYVLSQTDPARTNCSEQWQLLGQSFRAFYPNRIESLLLIRENIYSIYQESQQSMDIFLDTTDQDTLISQYEILTSRKEGMSFLLGQMLRRQTEIVTSNYPVILSQSIKSISISAIFLIISLLFLIAFSIRMVHIICDPIGLLVSSAKEITKGKYDIPDVDIINNNDEMGYLSQVFNEMKRHVAENFKHMEEIIELQKLLQSTELKALQAQTNPHFLFNVLALAEESALNEDASQTVEVIENISYMLQYSLKCTKQNVTLPEELRMVKAYLALQEKRFGDRLNITFSEPDMVPAILVPGISLQPIVENAFLHGVAHMGAGGHIRVRVANCPNYVEVTIMDNGLGIDPIVLDSILHPNKPPTRPVSHGIGMRNVIRRMEVFFHQNDLVSILSDSQSGTSVTIRFPLSGGNDPYVQSADS